MRVFIAGIMQGSRTDRDICGQSYRQEITEALRSYIPHVKVIDPLALNPNSVDYSPEQAKQTFLDMTELAGQVDALVAYVPAASMGTAIEMWHAYQNQVPVYTISTMGDNWVVRSLSTRIFPDLPAFMAFVADGGLHPVDA